MKSSNNNFLYLVCFLIAMNLFHPFSIYCLNTKNKHISNLYSLSSNLNINFHEKKTEEKILKIELKPRKTKLDESFIQSENKNILLSIDLSLGITQLLHFHPSVN